MEMHAYCLVLFFWSIVENSPPYKIELAIYFWENDEPILDWILNPFHFRVQESRKELQLTLRIPDYFAWIVLDLVY